MTASAPTIYQRRAGYAASLWAFLFAAVSFYWALGGQAGAGTIGVWAEQAAATRAPDLVLVLWITAALKALLGFLPLIVAHQWLPLLPRRPLIFGLGLAGAGMALYYLANFVQHLLMWAGTVPISAALGRSGLIGHLILWDPWWILGGALFLFAARTFRAN